jgi:hypothetical protein
VVFCAVPQLDAAPVRILTMKDHSVLKGKVVLKLSRYLVLRTDEGKVLAVQNAEIQTLEFLPRNGSPRASPTPSPTPKAKIP